MADSTLVPIPWQPALFLTPSTLSYLVAASNRLGRHLFLVGSDAAYRTFARQDFLYQGHLKKLAGVPGFENFNTASSPNPPGQRNHMRGAAFDLIDTSSAVQAACRAVGLVRDPVETWHWNDPRWWSMPIIPTNTATAGGGGIPLPTPTPTKEEDDDMPKATYYAPTTDSGSKAILAGQHAGPRGVNMAGVYVSDNLGGSLHEISRREWEAISALGDATGRIVGLSGDELELIAAANGLVGSTVYPPK